MSSSVTGNKQQFSGRIGILFIVLLLLSMLIGFTIYGLVARQAGYDREYATTLGEMRVLSQQMTTLTQQVSRGRPQTFDNLQQMRERFNELVRMLEQGNSESGMPPTADELNPRRLEMSSVWSEYNEQVLQLLEARGVIISLSEIVRLINEYSAEFFIKTDAIATQMAKGKKFSQQEIYVATRQLMLGQRIITNVNKIFDGGEDALDAANNFGRDAELFGRVLNGFYDGDAELGIKPFEDEQLVTLVDETADIFDTIGRQVNGILERSPEMLRVSQAVNRVTELSQPLLERLSELELSHANYLEQRLLSPMLGNIFSGLAVLWLILLGITLKREADRRIEETEAQRIKTEQENARNQAAILQLLDEMGDLADGDLTVNATVTEDITGAIADSMNFTIEALRSLVESITSSSQGVLQSAEQSLNTASRLTEASRVQTEQITNAADAVQNMASSIEGVSATAGQLAKESERSVTIAKKGAETVASTIEGMNTIREQIQETSKRIKRLGESSQEIGEIVELINDIAEQTNILSLNASIQAAMAGDAGRGFAVVADEVQRLAERSADATKQIEALVKTIQTDTNEAVTSMERSTSEVVSGAGLAQDAGAALQEIQTVADTLAQLIGNISTATGEQAKVAESVTHIMRQIEEVTRQTTEGTETTAKDIGKLAELAEEMKRSVSGFKLPQESLVDSASRAAI